ncbi:MAG: alpha/beta hydrolase [Bosea sp.]|uniref:alpha/beta hydrolase n=1 Tax=Bosea sp. (in: a-proteobacteria) TaxID=1871050 RepID=UPI001AC2BACE|nr:alpha/beta hydrolase [Bosea sp. (in: a-proteobacteria)]MBN9450370.1 alpha/beta hydrolase [Bosea sp. (in: a-proteobacteria)]
MTATTVAADFIHVFEPGSEPARRPLLLLHGTGGDERDLLSLGHTVAPGASLLSPRGKILEGSASRFFRRLAEGVFDEADLKRRTDELAEFVLWAQERYGLPAPIALGFSNGANIAAALLLQRPDILAGAALLRAMVPFAEPPRADLAGKPVLILSGAFDPIVPKASAERLAWQLGENGAVVEHRVLPAGHGLGQADIGLLGDWLARH